MSRWRLILTTLLVVGTAFGGPVSKDYPGVVVCLNMDEGSGLYTYDAAQNNLAGIAATAWVTGRIGNCFYSPYTAGGRILLSGSAAITPYKMGCYAAFWYKTGVVPVALESRSLVAIAPHSSRGDYFLISYGNYAGQVGLDVYFRDKNGTAADRVYGITFEPNIWYHIVAGRDVQANLIFVYINGVLVFTASNSGTADIEYSNGYFSIGNWYSSPNNGALGWMDDFIYGISSNTINVPAMDIYNEGLGTHRD